jgi:uncharacterized protein
MKYSQFNSLVPYAPNKKFALYNSYSQRVLFIEEGLKDLLEAAIIEGVDKLEEIHPSFYTYLVQKEFLLENDVDEIDKVKKLSKKVDESTDSFILTINPSMNCNFKCWYCYETHVKNSRLGEEMIERITKFIDQTAAKKGMEKFELSLFGGEPLLYFQKEVVPLIDAFYEACSRNMLKYSIFFTTNAYLITEDFINYFKNKGISCGLQITLDGYREKHDLVRFVSASKGSYETIVKNIKLLITNGFYVRLRINYTSNSVEDTYLIAKEFDDIPESVKRKNLMIDFQRVWQDHKIDNTFHVVNANAEQIEEKGIRVSNNYSPNSVKSPCYADKRNSVVINYNGDIFKCTARDFTKTKRAGYLNETGELVWENDYLERRMNAKFKNRPCLTCKIMPLCNGGCSQHALEHLESGTDYCVHSGDENEKMRVVKTKIDEIIKTVSV